MNKPKDSLELLPCPFCSNKDVELCDCGCPCAIVVCDNCGEFDMYRICEDIEKPEKVIKAWNTRKGGK